MSGNIWEDVVKPHMDINKALDQYEIEDNQQRSNAAGSVKTLEGLYTDGWKGFSRHKSGKWGNWKHLAEVPINDLVHDPDLLLMQQHNMRGERKLAHKSLMRYLSRNSKFHIKPTGKLYHSVVKGGLQ